MMRIWIVCALLLAGPLEATVGQSVNRYLVVVDPGHGGTAETDSYRVGSTGEREEWVNLRVAKELKTLLESEGVDVLLTRDDDVAVSLKDRALMAVENGADLFLSIHHNATADPGVNFPIVYYHGSSREHPASVALGREVICELQDTLYDGRAPMSLASDKTIFPGSGTGVLRRSQGIPGIIAEASFFTHPPEEQRLKNPEYNRLEAEAYARAILRFLNEQEEREVEPERNLEEIPPFQVFQEAERMRPEARQWMEQFKEGIELYEQQNWEEALQRLTLSARAFPDSPVAQQAHLNRSRVFRKLGDEERADLEERRAREYYVDLEGGCSEPFSDKSGI